MSDEERLRWRYDQARAWLEHVRGLSLRVHALTDELEAQRELAYGIAAMNDGSGGKTGSPSPDAVPNAVIRMQELVASYCEELASYVDEQSDAHRRIARLRRPEHVQALSGYYLSGHSWERVCVDMGYTWDGMMTLRRAAIQSAYALMPDEWRDHVPRAI